VVYIRASAIELSFETSSGSTDANVTQREPERSSPWIFVIPVIVAIAVVATLILDPRAATQISNAVEAEFGTAQAPAPVPSPPSIVAAVKAK
jgi:hypothetical protein